MSVKPLHQSMLDFITYWDQATQQIPLASTGHILATGIFYIVYYSGRVTLQLLMTTDEASGYSNFKLLGNY